MRIITGKYKGRALSTLPGRGTRPTSSFNREAVFSILQDLEGKRVLDLYAGSGSFGLEALSRGAAWVDFVEFASPAIAVLLKNISQLGCGGFCHVWRKRTQAFLAGAGSRWDIIFLDPPYARNLVNPTVSLIFGRDLLSAQGIVVAEHSPEEPIAVAWQDRILKSRPGKTSCFTLLA